MSRNNRCSIFIETLNGGKKEGDDQNKSEIIKGIEKIPELPPVNLYREYHDDYSRHRDRHVEEDHDARDNSPKSLP